MIERLKWGSIYFTVSVAYLILTFVSILSPTLAEKMLQEFNDKCEGISRRRKERYEEVSPQQTNRIDSGRVRFEKMPGIRALGADSQKESKRQSDCPG